IILSNPLTNGSSIQTEVGETVSLSCVAQDSSEGEELQWLRNGRLVKLQDGNRLVESHLCIHPVTSAENGVTFTCKLKANATVKAFIKLEVNYAPDLNGTEEVQIEEDSTAVLSCGVRAQPAVTVFWKKNGAVLDLSTSRYKASNNGITAQLTITNIKRAAHAGLYTCEATSPIYGVRSKSFNVIVGDKVLKFPLWPIVAGLIVVAVTIVLAMISRREKIMKVTAYSSTRRKC
ncbi:hypothetical protein NFI96_016322, partial [Prochilodus magdalenae]